MSALARTPEARVAFIALVAIVSATLFAFGGVYSSVWAPATVAACAACGWLVWRATAAGASFSVDVLLWPVLGFGFLVAAQWTFGSSVYRGSTLTGLCELAGVGGVFYLSIVAFRHSEQVRQFGTVCWTLTGALAALAIVETFTAGKKIYWYHDASYATPVGPFVYHNHFAGAMDLLLPIAVVVAFRNDRTGDSPWIGWLRRGMIPALGIASVVLSLSRGGLITLGVEATLATLLLTRLSKRVMFPLLFGAAALLGFSFLVDWSPIVDRFVSLGNHDPSWFERLQVGRSCLRIFRDHPLVGSGFNTFASVYPRYQVFDDGLNWEQAHDEYAQMLAETGIVGALCVAAFLLLFFRAAWQRRSQAHDLAGRTQLAAAIGCTGLLVHSFGDFQFHAPAIAFLFFASAAAATAPLTNAVRRRRVLVRAPAQTSERQRGIVVHTELTPLAGDWGG